MNDISNPAPEQSWPVPLPACLCVSRRGAIAVLTLNRAAKRKRR